MRTCDVVVQGMDALKDGDLILPQLQWGAPSVVAHLAGKLKFGDDDLLPPAQGGEVLVQQLHIQALGRFVVDVSLGGAGRGLAVQALEVVVHSHRVGIDAPALELLRDLHGGGGLARTRGPGEQHHGALVQIAQDAVCGQGHPLGIRLVALLQKLGDIGLDPSVDLLKLIGHWFKPPGRSAGSRPSAPELWRTSPNSHGDTWGW